VHLLPYRHAVEKMMGLRMLNRKSAWQLLGLGALACSAGVALPAQAAPSFGDCAKQIEHRGYVIEDMDTDGSGYDIDAMKGGNKWDLRVDKNCKVLKERLD
jgi:hypothetical protein